MTPLKNAKHEAFARAIVSGKAAGDAYSAAGYKASATSARTNAARLLANAGISSRIAELKRAAADEAVMDLNEVLAEQSKLGRADMRLYGPLLSGEDALAALDALPPELSAAIQQIELQTVVVGRGRKRRVVTRVKKFRLHSKPAALSELRAHHEPSRHQHQSVDKDGKPVDPPAPLDELALARRIAFALEQAARKVAKKE